MSSDSDTDKVLERLRENDIEGIRPKLVDDLLKEAREVLGYKPRIGFLGKTGVGKSSLCNSIFGEEIAEVDDVEACTREPEDFLLSLDESNKLTLIDVPGVGESEEKDSQYTELYEGLVPNLDIVVWVLKADDRAYSVEKNFRKRVLDGRISYDKFLVILNQADKISPVKEWDEENNRPGRKQRENLERKKESASDIFDVGKKDIVLASASRGYGMLDLVRKIIQKLSDKKRPSLSGKMNDKYMSKETKDEVRDSFFKVLKHKAKDKIESDSDSILNEAIKAAWDTLVIRNK